MSIPIPNRYVQEKLPKYPHLLPADVDLWERFMELHPNFFQSVEYDVHVGGAIDVKPWWSDKDIRSFSHLAAKRIDVVGHTPGEIWIIEVKPEAGVSAIGQLISYRLLYRKRFGPTAPLVLCLVTDFLTADERWLTSELKMRVFLV